MKQTDVNKKERGGWLRRSADIGARIVKSLFFWGMAAVLASSVYMDYTKISNSVKTAVISEEAKNNSGNTVALEEEAKNSNSGSTAALEEEAKNSSSGNTAALEEEAKNSNSGSTAALEEEAKNSNSGSMAALREDVENRDSGNTVVAEQADNIQKRVALTFDDGPHSVYTKILLDGLAERNVHATFFVIGKNIPGNEDLIARMQQEGHLIGNHTYDHVKICDLSGEEACAQVERTSELVREITGEDTEFVRPPFGAWNKSMECSFTMIPVMWDVDPLDWTTKNKALIEERVLSDVSSGDIILLHDYYESSVEAALELVDKLLEQGYEFVTVDELILE